jgi:ArsR family transcriptional regulator, arsenate/arsenite/antimonite-responsive transcriptional repressor
MAMQFQKFNRNIAIKRSYMGISKSQLFAEQHNQVANLAKALAHPARVAILEFLAKQGACVCGDIVVELPLAQATISQHLRELKSAGFIKGEIEGNSICYCIDPSKAENLMQFLQYIQKTSCHAAPSCC